MGSSHLLKEFCCVCKISCAIFIGCVSKLLFSSLRQSRGLFTNDFY